jgi:hypothetical protein
MKSSGAFGGLHVHSRILALAARLVIADTINQSPTLAKPRRKNCRFGFKPAKSLSFFFCATVRLAIAALFTFPTRKQIFPR